MDVTMFGSGAQRQRNPNTNMKPEVRADLVVELDYKTVKKEVWSKFIKMYGGGPSIVREKPSIYSNPIEENPVLASRMRSPSPIGAHKSRSQKVDDGNRKRGERLAQEKKNPEKFLIQKSGLQPAAAGEQQSQPLIEPPKNIFAKKVTKPMEKANKGMQQNFVKDERKSSEDCEARNSANDQRKPI